MNNIEDFVRVILNDGMAETITLTTSKGSVACYVQEARIEDGALFSCTIKVVGPPAPAKPLIIIDQPHEDCIYSVAAGGICVICGRKGGPWSSASHPSKLRYAKAKPPPPA